MSKKFITILISATLGLLLLSLIGYYFIIQNNDGNTDGGITSGFKNFFPFGGDGNPKNIDNNGNNNENPPLIPTENFTQKLRRLSTEPVAGAGLQDVQAGTIVRYIEKATGHIYEVELFSPVRSRISNTTIPVVYDAVWGNSNNSLITRYLKDDNQTVDTYSLTVEGVSTTTDNTISGINFPEGISDVVVIGSTVFYLQQGDLNSVGYTSNFSGGNKKLVWNSEIKEWLSQFVNTRTVALTTKPHQSFPGFLYLVDIVTGQVRSVLGGVSGLSTLVNSAGNQVLYVDQEVGVKMYLYDVQSRSANEIVPTTYPEKCAWSKKNPEIAYCAVPKAYLDNSSLTSWYIGLFSFNDDIWRYDLKNNTSSIIGKLAEDSGQTIDVVKPMLSDNEQYLIFTNKIDNSLWSLDITKE